MSEYVGQMITTTDDNETDLTLWIRQPHDRDFFKFGRISEDQRRMLQWVGLLDGNEWADEESDQ